MAKEKPSFLKKRSKRLLRIQVFVPPERESDSIEKVFWFFSTEKNAFLPFLPTALSWWAIKPLFGP